ncbi:aminodeoxychorismate/anthranilate synthase component II [bacterium]|nr:aminodeoxychorismate/anthranilate synthase component II [bacterium]MBU0899916.1 aminodeoxychorismate/anthranilate synthase component II [bacterium]MBU1153110.1 aminodeoxychorismate/anthranilate synthase component II [bacterium]MBU2600304.1 aminodeoxychorismate/anthranilate synthase component II [bacterium]
MILIIDNYDSFTYNLVQYVGELCLNFNQELEDLKVSRNDKISIQEIKRLNPKTIIISPGPGTPDKAGISKSVIEEFKGKIPILGVCLGHQCLGEVFKAKLVHADRLMHGKISLIYHDQRGIYKNIPNPFEATRYHSLILKKETILEPLEISAWTEEEEVMGIRHKEYSLEGVQFHPESILTKEGKNILRNFLKEHCFYDQRNN